MPRQFSAFRGLAIFLVVVNHSITLGLAAAREAGLVTPLIEKYILIALKEFGIIAVPIFLFLAGAFFVYAAQGKTIRQAYKLVVPGLIHTILPYLFWSMVYYGAAALLMGESLAPAVILKNLVVGYPFNFVPILVAFYLIAPLLVWACQRAPWLVLGFFLLYQLFLINVLRPGLLGFAFPEWASILALPVLSLPLAIWAVFYPLGVVFGQRSALWTPVLQRFWIVILALSLALYTAAYLTQISVIEVPLAEVFAPLAGILLLPLIRRNAIPLVRSLEKLGMRSYGLYLTNLIVISALLALVKTAAPWLLSIQSVLVVLLIAVTLGLPLLLMSLFERVPGRTIYRYVFG